jgi:LPS-assembly lipoprotein
MDSTLLTRSIMVPRTPFFVVTLLLLTACGFHLRGYKEPATLQVSSVYLQAADNSDIAQAVRNQLKVNKTRLTDTAEEAQYVLNLGKQKVQRRVLSVSATTGKAEEYQLILSVVISISASDGEALLSDQLIKVSRDYTFDANAVLGKSAEEEELLGDMVDQAVDHIFNRLNAVARQQGR